VHNTRAGKTECLAGQALKARPQRQVLALNLLHHQLPYRVLLGREMPPIDTRPVRVITGDTQGREQGAEPEELCILSPDGTAVEFMPTGDPLTTNSCCGGADLRTAYVTLTASGKLGAMDWPRPGLKLHFTR
jgi:hypothetical protein